VDWYEALYDAGIHYTDSVLGDFVVNVERMGRLDEIALVITSDHGEEFTEHGRLAHTQLYDENLRVPLLVLHLGAQAGRRAWRSRP